MGLAEEGDRGQSLHGHLRATSGPFSVSWGWVEGGLSGGCQGHKDILPGKGTALRGSLAVRGKVCILCQGQQGAVAVWGRAHSTCLGENGQEGSLGKVTAGSQVWQELTGDGPWVPGVQAELLRKKELDPTPAVPVLVWLPSLTRSLTHPLGRHPELLPPLGWVRGWALRTQSP